VAFFASLEGNMTSHLSLAEQADAADLKTFLLRASRLGCEHVRLTSVGTALAATVAVLTKQGLLDQDPTVLGVRVFELDAGHESVNTLVQISAMQDRLARDVHDFVLPVGQAGIAWAGVTPPTSGWMPVGEIDAAPLTAIAEAGIAEVAAANGLGIKIVAEVRRETWGRSMFTAGDSSVPAGAAFAALGLGFIPESGEKLLLSSAGPWSRLSSSRGHVLSR
jgi:hypothetical protein